MIRYALATLALPLLIGADAPSERVIDGDHLIAVTINGVVTRLRVDPSAPSIALVTPEVAQRAGLRMGRKLGIGFTYGVGPVLVSSSTAVARVDFGAGQGKTRIGWTERTYSAANDGTIGPAALPDTTVRIVLHAPRAVERTMTLRYDQPGFPDTIFGIGWSHASGQVDLDGQPLSIRFAPHAPRILATAGAAARLARVHGGSIAGDATMTQVAFGIARPVRTMTLERPFALGDPGRPHRRRRHRRDDPRGGYARSTDRSGRSRRHRRRPQARRPPRRADARRRCAGGVQFDHLRQARAPDPHELRLIPFRTRGCR